MKKVCILTDFTYLPPQYGLVPAVLGQLNMLLKYGYNPTLVTMEGFRNHEDAKKIPEGVTVKDILPFMHLFDYQLGATEQEYNVSPIGEYTTEGAKTNLKKQVKLTVSALEDELAQYDVVIEHDLLFQTWKIPFNQAIRDIGEKHPEIKWLHWCHSGPAPRPTSLPYPHNLRFMGMNNSYWVTMNTSMASKFAEMYNIPISKVKCVYHTVDPEVFGCYQPATIKLIEQFDILNPEVVCVLPSRLDHIAGKGIDHVIQFIGQLNKLTDAKLVIINSWSKGKEENLKSLENMAEQNGLPKENLFFTSRLGKGYENGVPRQVVHEIYELGNLFVMAPESETFSLVTVEAALTKNMLVLNDDLTVFHELMGDTAKYVGWGSIWGGLQVNRQYQPTKEAYMMDRAREVYEELKGNKVLQAHKMALRKFSSQNIFKTQLEPLIEG